MPPKLQVAEVVPASPRGMPRPGTTHTQGLDATQATGCRGGSCRAQGYAPARDNPHPGAGCHLSYRLPRWFLPRPGAGCQLSYRLPRWFLPRPGAGCHLSYRLPRWWIYMKNIRMFRFLGSRGYYYFFKIKYRGILSTKAKCEVAALPPAFFVWQNKYPLFP